MASNKRGFTLIEFMISLAILGILAGVLMLALNPVTQIKKGRDAKRKADLEQIRSALEMRRTDEDSYPNSLEILQSEGYIELPSDPSGYSYYYNPSTNTYELCAYLEIEGNDDCGNNCGAPGGAVCNYKVDNP